MKILVCPDSFKGTLGAAEAAEIIKSAFEAELWRNNPEIETLPVADGGEGTAEIMARAAGGTERTAVVTGPQGNKVRARYYESENKVFIIEISEACGLPLCDAPLSPESATTFGAGELAAEALKRGAAEIVFTLGGSATTDAGCGAAAALGAKFYDRYGASFVPTGGTLERIARIDLGGLRRTLAGARVTALCDVDVPLCGKEGAAYRFAPQKGAGEAAVRRLDNGLFCLSELIGTDRRNDAGAGAAGGFGFGAAVFFEARLERGVDRVFEAIGFDGAVKKADVVVTGEGRVDFQSALGKAAGEAARRARIYKKRCYLICGEKGEGAADVICDGIVECNPMKLPFEEVKKRAGMLLAGAAARLARDCLR